MGVEKSHEEELIDGCKKGDRDCQNALYKLFSPKMMIVCFRYSKTREDAEDTLMEGFMKVFENIAQFRKEGSFEGWIRKVMVNTAIAKYRKMKVIGYSVELEKIQNHYLEAENITSKIGAKELIGMIQQLPPAYQMVFNLYAFEGMKHKEIAEHLGISAGTSKSNLSDARTLLKRMIENSSKAALMAN